ncbi:MAG: DUF2892 domain-containing protein [Chitinophagaceae bacterium]|jgi:hypothetical protein|nr:DUF2892 domain-containing protein [Chitinophagaceae bacterium]
MKEKIIRIVAGSLILLSVALSVWVSPLWLWFTVFVGINLLQSAFSGFCPLEKILDATGITKKAG